MYTGQNRTICCGERPGYFKPQIKSLQSLLFMMYAVGTTRPGPFDLVCAIGKVVLGE